MCRMGRCQVEGGVAVPRHSPNEERLGWSHNLRARFAYLSRHLHPLRRARKESGHERKRWFGGLVAECAISRDRRRQHSQGPNRLRLI